jgi:hypothetical protein
MVGRWLYIRNDRYAKIYKQTGYDIKQTLEKNEGENKLDEKEEENFKEHQYFITIINEWKNKNILTKVEHFKFLLLCLLTLQPPLRTSFYSSAKFLRKITENNKIDNYLLINKRGKIKCSYIVNKDKASNYKEYNINKTLSKIDLDNEELIKLINDSFIKYPRTYLFENDKGEPVSDNTLLRYLRSITNVKLINFDMMRASYITHFYKDNKTYGEKNKLAHEMRHSVDTQAKNYNKIIEDKTGNLKKDKLKEEYEKLKIENDILKNKINTSSEPDDKKLKKGKYDAILKANSRGYSIKAETMNKYNIKYNEKTKLYY